MKHLRAVVPATILRRWDLQAAAQLCEAAAKLAVENETLQQRVERAERDAGDCWQMLDNEREVNRELAERSGAQLGITMAGEMVVLPREAH